MQIPLRPAACAAAFAISQGALAAPKEIRKPPVGETLWAEVLRGGRTDIALRAYEGRNNPLAYEIMRPPRYGTLSGFRQADANRQGFASVVYIHGDDAASREDDFTFRARAAAGGVSSPIAVKIRVVDEPPRLAASSRIDFTAFAGGSDLKMVGLTNAGGAILEGRFAPKEPFHVEGDGRFKLGRRESTNLSVRFSPRSTDGVPPQKITPSGSDPAATITLNAEAKAPFSAEAKVMTLKVEDGSREGEIRVTNFSSESLQLSLEVRPEGAAEINPQVRVAAGASAIVPVRIGPNKKSGPVDLSVRVSNAFFSELLAIRAPSVPPRLELLSKELDFRRNTETSLDVTNSGGVAGRFDLTLPGNITPLDGAAAFDVPAGKKIGVRLRLRASTGNSSGDVVAALGSGKTEKVAVLLPAQLEILTPQLDFRESKDAKLSVRNTGKSTGKFRLELPPLLTTSDGKVERTVPPGETLDLPLRWDGPPGMGCPPLFVNTENHGKVGVEVLTAPPAMPVEWILGEDLCVEDFADGLRAVSWRTDKGSHTDARLEFDDGGGFFTRENNPTSGSWPRRAADWLAVTGANLRRALGRPPTDAPSNESPQQEEGAVGKKRGWRTMELAAKEFMNPDLRLRVSAVDSNNGSRVVVSEEFRLDSGAILVPASVRKARQPGASAPTVEGFMGSPARVVKLQATEKDVVATLALSCHPDADKFAVEQVTGLLESGEPGRPPSGFATRKLSADEAQATRRGRTTSGDNELTVVEIRFPGKARAPAMLCRLVPYVGGKMERPSEAFVVRGELPPPWPWRSLMMFAGTALGIFLVYARLRQRRA